MFELTSLFKVGGKAPGSEEVFSSSFCADRYIVFDFHADCGNSDWCLRSCNGQFRSPRGGEPEDVSFDCV